MSVKEIVHDWIDKLPDDAPGLLELYEQAQLDAALDRAKEDVRNGRVITFEEMDRRMKEKWAKRDSGSN